VESKKPTRTILLDNWHELEYTWKQEAPASSHRPEAWQGRKDSPVQKKSTPTTRVCPTCGITYPNKEFGHNAACKRCRRDEYFTQRYGLTLHQVEEQAHEQGHVCAVCGQPETDERSPNLKVDYDRETGTLVGMLCLRCLQNVKALRCFNAEPKMQLLANIYIDNSQHSS
jgi:hypothetical protein